MEPRANAPVASPPWVAMRPIHRLLRLFLEISRLFPDILRIYPIIPEYSLILLTTYYARNYAGIIDACLILMEQSKVQFY